MYRQQLTCLRSDIADTMLNCHITVRMFHETVQSILLKADLVSYSTENVRHVALFVNILLAQPCQTSLQHFRRSKASLPRQTAILVFHQS